MQVLFMYLIGVLRRAQEYFTYSTAASIMVRRNWVMTGRNPRPSTGEEARIQIKDYALKCQQLHRRYRRV